MKKTHSILVIMSTLIPHATVGMSKQLTLHTNQQTQQGTVLLLNSSTYFTIPEKSIATSHMLKAMIEQQFEEKTIWNSNKQIVIDMSTHKYSNKSMLIFTDVMAELSSGKTSVSLQKYSTQTLIDLYELCNYFIVDARPLLLQSFDAFDFLLVAPEYFSLPYEAKNWEMVHDNSNTYFLIHEKEYDKKISLWDVNSKQTIYTLDMIHSYCLDQESRILATTSLHDNCIKLWNISNGNLITIISSLDIPELIGWHQQNLVIKYNHTTLALFDVSLQKITSELICQTPIVSVDQLHENNNFLVRTFGTELHIWDCSTGKTVHTFNNGYLTTCVSLSYNREFAAIGLSSGDLIIWNIHNGEIAQLPVDSLMSSLIWSPDGNHLAILFNYYGLEEKNQVHIWDIKAEKKIYTIKHKDTIEHASWNLKGDNLAVGGRDGVVTIFDVTTKQEKNYMHKDAIATLTWTGSKYLVSSDWSNYIQTYNTSNNKIVNEEKLSTPARSITWDTSTSSLIVNPYRGQISITKALTQQFSTDQLWLLLMLKKARDEGVTITIQEDSWAENVFVEFPKSIQLHNDHVIISNIKGDHGVETTDYHHTVSLISQNSLSS